MFRFTIRDVLWLTIVVGMAIVLWMQFTRANRLSKEVSLWELRAEQVTSDLLRRTGAKVKFTPKETIITYGGK